MLIMQQTKDKIIRDTLIHAIIITQKDQLNGYINNLPKKFNLLPPTKLHSSF